MTEFYVSLLGNDTSFGLSASAAFATLDAAIKAMAANGEGDTTYVLDGTYYLNGASLSLTEANSEDTITAYPGTNPVISGGTRCRLQPGASAQAESGPLNCQFRMLGSWSSMARDRL